MGSHTINSARFAGDRAILEYSVKTLQMLMDKINCAVKDHGMISLQNNASKMAITKSLIVKLIVSVA